MKIEKNINQAIMWISNAYFKRINEYLSCATIIPISVIRAGAHHANGYLNANLLHLLSFAVRRSAFMLRESSSIQFKYPIHIIIVVLDFVRLQALAMRTDIFPTNLTKLPDRRRHTSYLCVCYVLPADLMRRHLCVCVCLVVRLNTFSP